MNRKFKFSEDYILFMNKKTYEVNSEKWIY